MPLITPTLNLPQPPASSTKTVPPATTPTAATATPATPTPAAPSTTVTLSPQALSAAYAVSHPSAASTPGVAATPAAPIAAAHDGAVYESLKSGIATAVTDVGDAIADGAQAVVDGVETTLSMANKVAKGILELPFAAVSKGCDAVGALIDKL
jgi:hypothetical protein